MAENKVIVLRGVERAGADEIQTPGGLEQCVGLEAREGSLVPYAMKPKSNGRGCHYDSEDYDRILIHKTTNQQNVIFVGNGFFGYVDKATWDDSQATPVITTIAELYVNDIEQVGNMLCVSTSDGMRYFLWKNNEYVERSNDRSDYPTVLFRVDKGLYSSNIQGNNYGSYCSANIDVGESTDVTDNIRSFIQKAAGIITREGGLRGYFLACAAWKLRNGNYVNATPIVLLCSPDVAHENYMYGEDGTKFVYDDGVDTHEFVMGELFMRHTNNITGNPWDGFPILGRTDDGFLDSTSDKFSGMSGLVNYSSSLYVNKLVKSTPLMGMGVKVRFYTGTGVNNRFDYAEHSYFCTSASNKLNIKIGDVTDLPDDVSSLCIFISPEVNPFYNIEYEDNTENYHYQHIDYTGNGDDINYIEDDYGIYPKYRNADEIMRDILDITNLYKVHEIYKDDITSGSWIDIPLTGKLGDNLYVRESLPLTAWTYSEGLTGSLESYNMRLHVFDYKQKVFGGFVLEEYQDNCGDGQWGEGNSYTHEFAWEIDVDVEDPESGLSTVVRSETGISGSDFSDDVNPLIFFPDINATRIRFRIKDLTTDVVYLKEYPLTRWENMHGAYYIDSELKPFWCIEGGDDEETDRFPVEQNTNDSRVVKNGIRVSDTAYPQYFPAAFTYRVGNSEIVGLATLTNALNQDVFGPQPLLIFTKEGIWSMGVDASGQGAYTTILPFSREVCEFRSTICPIDGAVLFASKQGLMIANAQGVQEFCPALNGIVRQTPDASDAHGNGMKIFNGAISNDHLVKFEFAPPETYEDVFPYIDFRDYLLAGGTCVSYVSEKKKILVYNRGYRYVYWIDIPTRIATVVPMQIVLDDDNYPSEVYYTDNAGYTAERLIPTNLSGKCVLQTRPFKFNSSLQSIERVAVRGHFSNQNAASGDKVGVYVLGSYDNSYWRLIGGYEKDLNDVGFNDLDCKVERESYNYAMVIVSGKLDVNSHIDAIELTIKSKYNKKLR